MFYDEEAVYQDADIEMAQYAEEAARADARRAEGYCLHSSCQGIPNGDDEYCTRVRNELEAKGLQRPQVICTEGCGMIFQDSDEWHRAHVGAVS